MKIANIVYEKELVNHIKVDYINYYDKPVEYDSIDKNLPTLYVGWSFMKSCNPNNEIIQNSDILRKKIITNELYWECSFDESKSSHIKGVESFVNLAPTFYFGSKYQFINLDPIFFQLKDIQDIMDVISKKIDKVYKYKNEILYLLYQNKITGINLNLYRIFNFNIDEIKTEINYRTEIIYDDLDAIEYTEQYKKFPKFENLKRYMVVIIGNN